MSRSSYGVFPPLTQSIAFNSSYLDEIQTAIRSRPIPWDGYVRANLLTPDEAALIKTIEKQSPEARKETVKKDLTHYATSFVSLLRKIPREDVAKYILSFVASLVQELPEFAQAMLELSKLDSDSPFGPLLKLLESEDEQIQLLAVKSIVVLLADSKTVDLTTEKYAAQYLQFVGLLIGSSASVQVQDVGTVSLAVLLSNRSYRPLFWKFNSELVPKLLDIIKADKGGLHLQYYTLLVIWLESFDNKAAHQLVSSFSELIPTLLQAARTSVKEKITRLCVAIIVNVLKAAPKDTVASLLLNQGQAVFKNFSDRKWTDEELIEDIEVVYTQLNEEVARMTTFDRYYAEIKSGKLSWTPAHKSEFFWQENVGQFKDDDWKVLKMLAGIVKSATDPTVQAVACSDVANVCKLLPDAIQVLQDDGAKLKIMELMSSDNSEVRFEALKATQVFVAQSLK